MPLDLTSADLSTGSSISGRPANVQPWSSTSKTDMNMDELVALDAEIDRRVHGSSVRTIAKRLNHRIHQPKKPPERRTVQQQKSLQHCHSAAGIIDGESFFSEQYPLDDVA